MPSGSKKRKAAKKKKEKEIHINTNNPQGNDELKSQDDKGSDCGSPASHDHDHDHDHDDDHHHPFNEGNEETEEGDPSVRKSMEKEVSLDVKIDDEAVVREEEGGVAIPGDLEPEENRVSKDVNVVHTKSTEESSYENGNSGSSPNVEMVSEKSSKDGAADNSLKETVMSNDLVKSTDLSHAKVTVVSKDAQFEETGDSFKLGASVSEANDSDTGNALREKPSIDTRENVKTSSLEVPKEKEFENMVLPSANSTSLPESTNGTELAKDSDTAENSENQHVVTSAPRMVQKTSWLNCCGLFEVLSGSNR